jgi:hypothetical protein
MVSRLTNPLIEGGIVPSLQKLLLIHVVVNGNVGITTLQHVLAVHAAADTPTPPPDDTTAKPIIIADRSHRRCDDARAPRGHKPPPVRMSTEAAPTLPTETIERTVDQKSRYVGRRTTCGAGTGVVPTFTVAPVPLTPPPEQVHVTRLH